MITMIHKEQFDVQDFDGDYFEEYKGYEFSVGLDIMGYQNAAILFPPGIKIQEDYMHPKDPSKYTEKDTESANKLKELTLADESVVATNNWFVQTIINIFFMIDSDIFVMENEQQVLLFRLVGVNRDPKAPYITIAKEKDYKQAEEKYKDFYIEHPEAKAVFDKCRKNNNLLEEHINQNDHEWFTDNLPSHIKEIYFFTQEDVIEMCHKFIDELKHHEQSRIKHRSVLDKIKMATKEKNDRMFNNK